MYVCVLYVCVYVFVQACMCVVCLYVDNHTHTCAYVITLSKGYHPRQRPWARECSALGAPVCALFRRRHQLLSPRQHCCWKVVHVWMYTCIADGRHVWMYECMLFPTAVGMFAWTYVRLCVRACKYTCTGACMCMWMITYI